MLLIYLRHSLCCFCLVVVFAACSNSECHNCASDVIISENVQGVSELIRVIDSIPTISSNVDSDSLEEEGLLVSKNLPFDDSIISENAQDVSDSINNIDSISTTSSNEDSDSLEDDLLLSENLPLDDSVISENVQDVPDSIKDIDSIPTTSSNVGSDSLGEDGLLVSGNLPFDDSEYPYVGLPRIAIKTEFNKEIEDRENYVNAKFQIFGQDKPESEVYDMLIRGRGNTTWVYYPKKPYAIKFDKKVSLFGMPSAKKWVLLANYRERTLMRNALAFKVASNTDLEWSPKGVFVELFLNGTFLGNYYLCEKVEVKESRVNIDKNAYLLEFDKNYDEEYKFRTAINDFPVNIKNPDNPTAASLAYIQNYVDTVESILYGNMDSLDIEEYIDLKSFVDYFIVYNISQNYEINHPKSVFMHKDLNGKLTIGPVWDFDYMTFNPSRLGLCCEESLWYDKLLKNENFISLLKQQWNSYKDAFFKNDVFIDSIADYIRDSNERNYSIWGPLVSKKI